MKVAIRFALVIVVAAALAGCAEAPTGEVQVAKDALSAAEQANAGVYAAEELKAASVAVAAAEAEISAQGEKFALTRKYDKASSLIKEATEKAEKAKTVAIEAEMAARSEAETILASTGESIQAVEATLVELSGCEKTPKGFETDLAALNGSLEALKAELTTLESAIGDEDYIGASARGKSLAGQVELMLADLTSAQEKTGCVATASSDAV